MFFHKKRAVSYFVGGFLSFSLFLSSSFFSFAETADEKNVRRSAIPIESNAIENWPEGPVVSAQSAILMDVNTHTILYEKNAYESLYPASITKILACLVAAESDAKLSDEVSISYEAVHSVPIDGTNVGLDAGQSISFEDALYAILLKSANEATNAIGEHVAGSIPDFVQMMNDKAKELGCMNSHFVTSNGLHDENHYTCAYDMALIGSAFFSNELLCKISGTKYHQIPVTDTQPDLIDMYSTNQLLPGRNYSYPYFVGSKTGYTSYADSTLVSCAEKDGMKLVCVVLGEVSPKQYEDTVSLFEYGFSNFSVVHAAEFETEYTIHTTDFFQSDLDVFGNSEQFIFLDATNTIILPNTIKFEELQKELLYQSSFEHCIATISYSYQNHSLGFCNVRLNTNTPQDFVFDALPVDPIDEIKQTESSHEFVFINIMPIIIILVVCIILIFLGFFFKSVMKNYHFSSSISDRKLRKSVHSTKRHTKATFAQRRHQKANRKIPLKNKKKFSFSNILPPIHFSRDHFSSSPRISKDTRNRLKSPRKKHQKKKSMKVSIQLSKDHFD